ncbi:MAG: ATP synthase F0 subunit A [Candidatus Ryanbacteria bacterium RIFCSPLOWO2_02_FULL_47_14]|uniref:ATP synthase subunit a n=1 Tax=Candidatus Ryanbacteria bacterium RIFCSPLOWO2_02_FULL_47_14 TaxID=1802129 RepID=A0A1G2GXG4_9BACT|nr:MAG: ATP synthase F0 subunit A [Candidatus Ryanbacteria bacterium RIFCSPHIGHO2_02_FULL_47_25]OGZ54894.1 MAG: ATP synthase F0 subunit A [Candidatus Ryanbacteria bacterium RIFCSPLOWO2_02_FULL_47_14]
MTEISIKAEELFHIGSWPVTNSLLLALVSLVVLAVTAFALHRKLALIPGKLQGIFEMFADEMLGLMDSVLGGRAMSEKYFPLIASVFTFILISNWLGLLPVVGSVGIREDHSFIPLFRAPAADLNFTVVLAIVSVFAVQILGVVAVGAGKHFSKYFTLKNPILTFAGLLEFIAEFVKIISFSFRLFGNVFAGEVLLIIIGFLVPYILPLPFLFLEVFVGFVQALIFAMLTLVFVAMAVREHEAH